VYFIDKNKIKYYQNTVAAEGALYSLPRISSSIISNPAPSTVLIALPSYPIKKAIARAIRLNLFGPAITNYIKYSMKKFENHFIITNNIPNPPGYAEL